MLHVNEKNDTIAYYDKNAGNFIAATQEVDFSGIQNHFLSKLNQTAHILDFGCGSGRDTRFFIEQGYQVTAVDGSRKLCQLASAYTGICVKHMLFQELSDKKMYDAIWACASILHLPYQELQEVFVRMSAALKENGIVYTSFKYGSWEGMRNGRYFTDMTEEKIENLLCKIKVFQLEEQWISSDVRAGREEERWLNLILQKS